jgi:hypothetical protein
MTVPQKKHELLSLKPVPIDQLLLDPENPRLDGIAKSTNQIDLIRAMWKEMAVSEVALSIAENGYFEEEPLFVVPAPAANGKERYYVVEGNRRLTAVKLLVDADLRSRIKATDLPAITSKRRTELQELPVSVYKKREDLWEFFGFRHVNGPKEWDSLSKAAYIAKVRREYEKTLEEIARKIGDQHSTVERIYRGYMLLEQAEEMTAFARDDRIRNRFYFSHLYTATGYPEVLDFLGTDRNKSLHENPVPKRCLSQLEELMTWLFGSKERAKEPAVRTQAPDLRYLRSVIGNKQALAALRSGVSLHRSYSISLGDTRRFEQALAEAKDSLQEAKGTVTTGYRGERELLGQMESITTLSDSILIEMRDIAEGKKTIK